MAADGEGRESKHIARVVFDWSVKWGGYAGAALSVLWSALLLVVAKNDLHLVAWIERTVEVYPARTTWQSNLPLSFKNTPARDVRVVQLRVENYGRELIGTQEKTWQLTIRAPVSDSAAIIGGLRVSPQSVVARRLESKAPNEVLLDLGALPPRAAVSLDVMLVNTKRPYRMIELDTSLAGLPRELSMLPPSEHLFERLAFPVILSAILLFWIFAWPEVYQAAKASGPPLAWALAWRILAFSGFGVVLGGVIAAGLSKVVAKFL